MKATNKKIQAKTPIDDKQADVLRDKAMLEIKMGNWEQALESLESAYAIRPGGPYIRLHLINTLLQLKRFDEITPHLDFLTNPPNYVLKDVSLNKLLNEILSTGIVQKNDNSLDWVREDIPEGTKYWSCDHLESSIVVLPKEIVFCCYPIPPGLKRPAVVENVVYDETFSFDINHYLNTKKKIIAQNQTKNPRCKDCSYLKLADWSDDQKIKIVRLAPSFKCNFACSYCPQPHEQARTLFPINIIEQLMEQGILHENFLLALSGGEPALLENFAETCLFAIKNKLKMNVATNGTVYEPALHDALKANLATVIISVDAGIKETYQAIKKTKLFEKVWVNISKYSQENNNLILKYIFIDTNLGKTEIEEFVQRALNAKVSQIHVSFEVFHDQIPSDEIIAAAAYMFSYAKKQGIGCTYSSWLISCFEGMVK